MNIYIYAEVLNEFATKKCVKLGKLLKEGGGLELKKKKKPRKKTDQEMGRVNPNPNMDPDQKKDGANVSHMSMLYLDHYNFLMTGSVVVKKKSIGSCRIFEVGFN